jgi:hypothetical protein
MSSSAGDKCTGEIALSLISGETDLIAQWLAYPQNGFHYRAVSQFSTRGMGKFSHR